MSNHDIPADKHFIPAEKHYIPVDKHYIPAYRLILARVGVLAAIGATSLVPLFFVSFGEPAVDLNIYKLLAKVGSLLGGMFLIWQFLLGFRGALAKLFPDLIWLVTVHKNLGRYGIPLIALHPVFITIYYLARYDSSIFPVDLSSAFSVFVFLGLVLFLILAFIVISSAFFRAKMGFYQWLYTHLSAYVLPPLLFLHSLYLGSTLAATSLKYIWWGLAGLTGLLYLYRIAYKSGLFSRWYMVKQAQPVADGITEIIMQPERRGLKPALGQFVYVHEYLHHNSHPYTVSYFSEKNGELGITPKSLGPQSRRLQRIRPGERLVLDGPFGIFTRVALAGARPIAMIAGGIGITPFRRLWQRLEQGHDYQCYLFYAVKYIRDIAYKTELDNLRYVHVVYVLQSEPDYPGERGYVTLELLKRYLTDSLPQHFFLLCGPPPMVLKLEAALQQAGVPGWQIRHELFSY